jgi:hypothetical protein
MYFELPSMSCLDACKVRIWGPKCVWTRMKVTTLQTGMVRLVNQSLTILRSTHVELGAHAKQVCVERTGISDGVDCGLVTRDCRCLFKEVLGGDGAAAFGFGTRTKVSIYEVESSNPYEALSSELLLLSKMPS